MPKDVVDPPYPGSTATAREVLDLAKVYQATALTLFDASTGRGMEAARPAHLCALQAIELALNAWRRHMGEPFGAIRSRGHDLSCPIPAAALGLRHATTAHLVALTGRREYLRVRYDPTLSEGWSHRTRITATMNEVVSKVSLRFNPTCVAPARTAAPPTARRPTG